ncbi:cytosine permease [Streptomyces sp. NPDC091412]|uniref:cytosine permease n=1 Tax=Streptomyces sp. NPDC091412 TaxID=3366002 RepID=UPI0038058BBB
MAEASKAVDAAAAIAPAEDGTLNDMPLLPRERIWGFWQYSSVNIGLSVATWAFLQGAACSYYVGAREAIVSIVIGYAISVLLVSLAPCLPSAKYGVEQFILLRSAFGINGARIVMIVMSTLFAAAWAAVLAIMLGHGLVNLFNELFGLSLGHDGAAVSAIGVITIVVAWLVLARGPVSVERVSTVVAPVLIVILLGMGVLIFTKTSWTDLTHVPALAPDPDSHTSFTLAIELGIAGGFAWWPNLGNLARLTTSPRAAFWPNWLGVFLASVVAAVVGAFAALALQITEPTDWMIPLGGAVLGAIALAAIAFANLTAILSQGYGSMVALRSGGGALFRSLPWPVMGVIILGPAAVLVLFPAAVYENYGRFLSWGAIFVAPLCAIQIVDFFFLRKTSVDVRELYEPTKSSVYGFWRGFNVVSFVAIAAGAATYALLLDPISYVPSEWFPYLTASIPSFAVAGITYLLLTKLVTMRMGQGGYQT